MADLCCSAKTRAGSGSTSGECMKNIGRRSTASRTPVPSTFLSRALLLLLPCLLEAGTIYALDLDRQVTIDIPAGASLEQALLDLGVKAGTPISFATDRVVGHKTPALKGTFTLAIVLATLFKDSGLSYTVVNDTIYVLPVQGAAAGEGAKSPSTLSARSQPARSPKNSRRQRNRSPNPGNGDTSMAEVTISATGTHIHDSSQPLGTHVVRRPYFERSGFQTVGDVLRSLAESFPGGLNPGVTSAGGSQNTHSPSGASSANLHGMGSASTLTLLNGHRLATSEGSGAVDVTLIPLSAVDRIEVITGGAAAVYGSDAVAGVVNIILRDDYQGLEMSSAVGSATDGGGFLQHYSLLGGHAWERGNAFADIDCARQHEIDSSQRSFVPAVIAGTTLLPKSEYCSTVVSMTRDLAGRAAGSLTGIYTTRENDESQNLAMLLPGAFASTRARVAQYAAMATVRAPLGADWIGTLASTVSADNVSSPQQLIQLGVPGGSDEGNKIDNRLWSAEWNLDGTLLQLPTGAVKLAAGAGYNQEDLVGATSNPAEQSTISGRRRVRFVYTEALLPLLPLDDSTDETDTRSSLMLRIAGRAAWYSDVGSTVNPKIGLLYRPTPEFGIEASWGTSYRAPTLLQQYNTSQVTLERIPDQGVESTALLEFGGNPRLRPEESSDLTLDFALAPRSLPGSVLKISLFDIDDRKRIDYPTLNTPNPLSDMTVLPFVEHSPSASTIAQILQQSQLVNLTDGPNGPYKPSDATLLIDDRNQNITRQHAYGLDLAAAQGADTPIGRFDAFLNVAYLDLRQQVSPASPTVALSGTIFYPPTWRGRLALNWKEGGYRGAVFVNYVGPSRNTTTSTQDPIASWKTVDASVGYILAGSGHRANTRLTLSAQNVLNRRPPFANTYQLGSPTTNFDSTNTSAIGRSLTLQVTLER
jgi:iron complex outermembrane recepter protein